MALYPWRLQGDIKQGDIDPMVTVFLGPERAVMDADGNPIAGETFIQQDTSQSAVMKLSELGAALADPAMMATRAKKPI